MPRRWLLAAGIAVHGSVGIATQALACPPAVVAPSSKSPVPANLPSIQIGSSGTWIENVKVRDVDHGVVIAHSDNGILSWGSYGVFLPPLREYATYEITFDNRCPGAGDQTPSSPQCSAFTFGEAAAAPHRFQTGTIMPLPSRLVDAVRFDIATQPGRAIVTPVITSPQELEPFRSIVWEEISIRGAAVKGTLANGFAKPLPALTFACDEAHAPAACTGTLGPGTYAIGVSLRLGGYHVERDAGLVIGGRGPDVETRDACARFSCPAGEAVLQIVETTECAYAISDDAGTGADASSGTTGGDASAHGCACASTPGSVGVAGAGLALAALALLVSRRRQKPPS